MTEAKIKEFGFELVKQYDHDQFNTNRYKLGVMEVEFTYDNEKLITCDMTISEVDFLPVTVDTIKALTPILGDIKQ